MRPKTNERKEPPFNVSKQYLNELGLVPLLSCEEEQSLANSIEANYIEIFSCLCDNSSFPDGLTLLQEEYLNKKIPATSIVKYEEPLRREPSQYHFQAYFQYCYRELNMRRPILLAGKNLCTLLNGNNTQIKRNILQAEQQIQRDREHFILANRRLVASIAKHYLNYGLTFTDLNQEGTIGLITAVDKYDQNIGRFSTHAKIWIRQAITRAITSKSRIIYLPVNVYETITVIKRVEKEFIEKLNYQPTNQEIAQKLNVDIKIIENHRYLKEPISLSTPLGENDSELEITIADEQQLETIASLHEQREIIEIELHHLLPREKHVIRERYGLSFNDLSDDKTNTLDNIGYHFGISRERIRQLEARSLRKLKKKKSLRELYQQI